MNSLATLHVCAVAFWFGVVSVEFVIERSRAESKSHGYSVARNHYWIDLLLELPAALTVLGTGLALLVPTALTPLLTIKIVAGLIAVGVNVLCAIPVALRKFAADAEQLTDVIRHSRTIDHITALGLPAGLIALILGLWGTA